MSTGSSPGIFTMKSENVCRLFARQRPINQQRNHHTAPAIAFVFGLLAVCFAACSPSPVPSVGAPVVLPVEAGRIIDQATATSAALATSNVQMELNSAATSTAVANQATSLALTPTAQAVALAMRAAADNATATVEARSTAAEATQAAGRIMATQAVATAAEQAREDMDARRAAQANADWWAQVFNFARFLFVSVLVALAVVLIGWLALKLWHNAMLTRAKVLMELVKRSGQGMIRVDLADGSIQLIADTRRPEISPPAAKSEIGEVPHIPVHVGDETHRLDMSGRPPEGDVLDVLDRALEYLDDNPTWPANKLPRWNRLGVDADKWTRAVKRLGPAVTPTAKGTFIAGRFADLSDLRQRVASGALQLA